MIAFVLSGGANYGALQAGALEMLLKRNIRPDILVGVSAGALNAAWLAAHPTLDGARQLANVWRNSAPACFLPPNRLNVLLRLARGKDSLLPNDSLQQFVRQWILDHRVFGEFKQPRLYVLAVHLASGEPRVFGDHPDDRLLDGLMASTAHPLLFPPWEVDGQAFVDGGVYSTLPLHIAIERGARQIYALQIARPRNDQATSVPDRALEIGFHALGVLSGRSVEFEIYKARLDQRKVSICLIRLWPRFDPGFWNFNRAASLIADGRRLAENCLGEKREAPLRQVFRWLW